MSQLGLLALEMGWELLDLLCISDVIKQCLASYVVFGCGFHCTSAWSMVVFVGSTLPFLDVCFCCVGFMLAGNLLFTTI